MSKFVTVLDPVTRPTKKELPMAIRPKELKGKVVGVVWNQKPGGDTLLNRIVELLDAQFHLGEILWHSKPSASVGVAEDVLNKFSVKCDFVITGPGD